MAVQVLEGNKAQDFLDRSWPQLYAADTAATPYQSASWLSAWAVQLTAATPIVLAMPGAALALVRQPHDDGMTRVVPLSAPHAEYVRPVGPAANDASTAADLTTRLEQLAREGDLVELTDIPAACAWGSTLASRPFWHCETTPCASVPLPVDYAAMSRSTRKEHRRRGREWDNLKALGQHVVYRRTSTVTELTTAYPALLDLHSLQRPDQDQAHAAKTWTTVLQDTGSQTAFIATLELNDTIVAAQLCLYRGQRCYSLRPAIHPDYSHLAPGHALLRHITEDLATEGFTHLDLGRTVPDGGQIGYKNQYLPRWSDTITARSGGLRRRPVHSSHACAVPAPA